MEVGRQEVRHSGAPAPSCPCFRRFRRPCVGFRPVDHGLGCRYLVWRLSGTLNLQFPLSTGWNPPLLVAELMLLGHGWFSPWLSRFGGGDGREAIAATTRLEAARSRAPQTLPSVAVLVPSRGEAAEVIERCPPGCLAIKEPK
jgi:cellulose synthase (UDP-forming)